MQGGKMCEILNLQADGSAPPTHRKERVWSGRVIRFKKHTFSMPFKGKDWAEPWGQLIQWCLDSRTQLQKQNLQRTVSPLRTNAPSISSNSVNFTLATYSVWLNQCCQDYGMQLLDFIRPQPSELHYCPNNLLQDFWTQPTLSKVGACMLSSSDSKPCVSLTSTGKQDKKSKTALNCIALPLLSWNKSDISLSYGLDVF